MISIRTTPQKIKILEHLKSVKNHPTAETVYKEVMKSLPNISLATVYRNLNRMVESGEILKIEINNEAHFDGDVCDHQHAICNKCGKIFDIFETEVSEYALKSLKSNDFTPSCVTIIYKGICNKCKGGK